MRKGGYKIIDLKDTGLVSGTPVTIPGIHESLENNYRKATLLSGLVIDGTEYPDMYVYFSANTPYTAEIAGLGSLTVTAEDAVTFTERGN